MLKIFGKSVRVDILSGLDREVFAKCNGLIDSPSVVMVRVSGLSNRNICEESIRGAQVEFVKKFEIYFGEDETSDVAGTIEIGFHSQLSSAILGRMIAIILLIIFFLFCGYWLISAHLLKRETKKFALLANILTEGDMKVIEGCSSLFPGKQTIEIESLCKSMEKLVQNWHSWQAEIVKSTRLSAINESSRLLAHDIKSPVGAIRAAAQMMEKKPMMSMELLTNGLTRIEKMLDELVINELPNQEKIKRHSVDLKRYYSELRDGILLQYSLNVGIEIFFSLSASAENPKINVDLSMVDRAFRNLIKNAVEALGDGSGRLDISFRLNTEKLVVVVQDDGPGLPDSVLTAPDDQKLVSSKEGGHGLGIYQARQVVRMHGGVFRVESEIGVGAKFTLTFPV